MTAEPPDDLVADPLHRHRWEYEGTRMLDHTGTMQRHDCYRCSYPGCAALWSHNVVPDNEIIYLSPL